MEQNLVEKMQSIQDQHEVRTHVDLKKIDLNCFKFFKVGFATPSKAILESSLAQSAEDVSSGGSGNKIKRRSAESAYAA